MPIVKLHKDCIFIQLDEKSVIFRHTAKPGQELYHYTPETESACFLFNLLAMSAAQRHKAGHKPHGIDPPRKDLSDADLVQALVREFELTQQDAENAVNEFLNALREYDLVEEKHLIPHNPGFPRYEGKGHARFRPGGTVISVGYKINWYRP